MKTRYPISFVVNILAEDRPGIIAAATKAILAHDGNIDRCSQTLLAEYFTFTMIVSFPRSIQPEQLQEAITRPAGGPTGLQVHVLPYRGEQPERSGIEGDHFVLTAFGADREGIVQRFASFLADKGINISDLYGTSEGEQFVLISQVQVPKRWDIEMLQADLEHLANEIGHTVRLQHENVFVATNQLQLPHTSARTTD